MNNHPSVTEIMFFSFLCFVDEDEQKLLTCIYMTCMYCCHRRRGVPIKVTSK